MTNRGKRRTVAAIAALGMATTTLAVGMGSSQAATITKTLNYSCNLPIVGVTTIPIKVNITFPDSIVAGDTLQGQASTDITVPANVQAALPIIGATQADLQATLHGTWGGALSGTLDSTVSITGAKPPASGAWTISAPASVPPVPTTGAGAVTLTAGTVDTTLTPRNASGGLTGLGVVQSTCTLVAGQDPALASFTIDPKPVPTTPAPTTAPPTTAPATTTPATTTPATTAPATTTPTTSPATTTPGSSAPSTSPSTAPPTTPETTPAPPPGPLMVTFDLNGTTKLRKLGVEAPIGPGTLTAKLDLATGAVDGDLHLPPSTPLKIKVLGLPLSANFGIQQVGSVTGSFVDGVVRTSAKANLNVSQLKLGRLTLLKGTCTTVKPVSLDLVSEPGFSPIAGGTVSGTYTIPKFGGCGFIGMFVNLLVPGSGNTLSLTLTPKV